jgi:hypothetical protein
LGKNTVNALFVQYGYAFSAAKKNAPASMVNDVNKMNTKQMVGNSRSSTESQANAKIRFWRCC